MGNRFKIVGVIGLESNRTSIFLDISQLIVNIPLSVYLKMEMYATYINI